MNNDLYSSVIIFASTKEYALKDDDENLFGFDPKKNVKKSDELITSKEISSTSPKNIQIRGAKNDEEESNLKV